MTLPPTARLDQGRQRAGLGVAAGGGVLLLPGPGRRGLDRREGRLIDLIATQRLEGPQNERNNNLTRSRHYCYLDLIL
jgi:hypothetical protein